MKLLNYIFLAGCQGAISSPNISQKDNSSLISNQKLNSAIEIYIDKYLSEIIRIRNFNSDRVSKVFCVHHTGYIESPVTEPDFLQVYVKLRCVEFIPPRGGIALPIVSGASIGNSVSIISRIDVNRVLKSSEDKKVEETFYVASDDTPRAMPYYSTDIKRVTSNSEIIRKLHILRSDEKANYLLLQKKADEYQKKKPENCK
jgi:hypothetical protein